MVTNNIAKAIAQIEERGYHVGYVLHDIRSGAELTYNADEVIYGASTIKGPYVCAAIREFPAAAEEDYEPIQKILLYSSNEDYGDLRDKYGTDCMVKWCSDAGLDPAWGKEKWLAMNARQLCMLWQQMHRYFSEDALGAKVGEWFEQPETSPIREVLKGKYVTRTKAGWINGTNDYYQAANDGGIVYAGERPYILAIMSNASAKLDLLEPLVKVLDEAHEEMK